MCAEKATKRQRKAYGVEGTNAVQRDPVLGETFYTNVVCCLSDFEPDSICESAMSDAGTELMCVDGAE